jgi:hypothetical protein
MKSLTPRLRTAILAFGATLAVAAGIFAATLTDRYAAALSRLDSEILLLFLPCCALIFAVVVEATRMTASGVIDVRPPSRRLGWNDTAADR